MTRNNAFLGADASDSGNLVEEPDGTSFAAVAQKARKRYLERLMGVDKYSPRKNAEAAPGPALGSMFGSMFRSGLYGSLGFTPFRPSFDIWDVLNTRLSGPRAPLAEGSAAQLLSTSLPNTGMAATAVESGKQYQAQTDTIRNHRRGPTIAQIVRGRRPNPDALKQQGSTTATLQEQHLSGDGGDLLPSIQDLIRGPSHEARSSIANHFSATGGHVDPFAGRSPVRNGPSRGSGDGPNKGTGNGQVQAKQDTRPSWIASSLNQAAFDDARANIDHQLQHDVTVATPRAVTFLDKTEYLKELNWKISRVKQSQRRNVGEEGKAKLQENIESLRAEANDVKRAIADLSPETEAEVIAFENEVRNRELKEEAILTAIGLVPIPGTRAILATRLGARAANAVSYGKFTAQADYDKLLLLAREQADRLKAMGKKKGAASAFMTKDGKITTSVSGGRPLDNNDILGEYISAKRDVKLTKRELDFLGGCAEGGCLQNLINTAIPVEGGVMMTVGINIEDPTKHGEVKPPCGACRHVLKRFGVKVL